jgi:hypothetical protein
MYVKETEWMESWENYFIVDAESVLNWGGWVNWELFTLSFWTENIKGQSIC